MNAATSIKNAMNELEVVIHNLSSFPETDNTAICALRASTAARVFLREALRKSAPDDTQPGADHLTATLTPSPATPKRQTTGYPFFPCSARKDKLFSVNEGIPLAGALEQASCFLESAQAITGIAEDVTPAVVYGAAYLIEMAKAVVDATVRAIYIEEAAGAK